SDLLQCLLSGVRSLGRSSKHDLALLSIEPFSFFFSSRRRHTSSVSAFLLNRSSDLTETITSLIKMMLVMVSVAAISKTFGLLRRSEERRVGKECRSRWWPCHQKKKTGVH